MKKEKRKFRCECGKFYPESRVEQYGDILNTICQDCENKKAGDDSDS